MNPRSLLRKPLHHGGVLAAIACAIVLGLASGAACSDQGEGERCDVLSDNGGNDDCQNGLQCTPKGTLGTNSDICCPPDRSQATTQVCRDQSGSGSGDAAPPGQTDATTATDTGTAADSQATDATDASDATD